MVFGTLLDIVGKLGILGAVKDKLLHHPDPASDKLVQVLSEIKKTYLALDTAITKYLSLSFDDPNDLYEERKALIETPEPCSYHPDGRS